jgi:hypothetical protein
VNVLQAFTDKKMFGRWFGRGWLRGDSWAAWRSFLSAVFALPMDIDAKEIYTRHTGRTDTPTEASREAFVIAGRRSGKSRVAAFISTYLAACVDYSGVLVPGEVGTVMIIAADRKQAGVILRYIVGFFENIPMLAQLVASRTKESITLTTGIVIEVHTCSYRSVRGFTCIAAICDEVAFWRAEDSANPDAEILNALRPSLATVPSSLLLAISSPYSKRGILWSTYRTHYGKVGAPTLVWKGASVELNPTLSTLTIAASRLLDPAAAKSEWDGEFRDDVSDFLTPEVVQALVVSGRFEIPPVDGIKYTGFVDPSGGSADSMTLGISHLEKDVSVLDALREVVPPFSPENTVEEFCTLLKSYRISKVTGDRYAGEWPREQFRKRGIEYEPSELTCSEIYLELLPRIMSGQIQLLDNSKLIAQLVGLERRTSRSGKDAVSHAPGAHDDIANACSGALTLACVVKPGVLGVFAYLKKTATYLFALPPKTGPVQSSISTTMMAHAPLTFHEQMPPCPECKAICVARCSGRFRCNACGFMWGDIYVAAPVTRGAMLSGEHSRRQIHKH